MPPSPTPPDPDHAHPAQGDRRRTREHRERLADMTRRLAVGVLASGAPAILAETLRHWPEADAAVYVHVDAKFDAEPFGFVDQHPAARLIPARHRVMWGGFSLVDAELSLMEAALADGFEHFVLISDDTVPLMPAEAIADRLAAPESWAQLDPTDNPGIWSRYRNYYCCDIGVSNPRHRPLEYDAADADRLLELHMLMKHGKFPLDALFWSSQWKALPHRDVEYVAASAADRGHLYSSFRYAMIPDEHYIQTLLGRRPDGLRCVRNFIWADFSRDPKPYVLRTPEDVQYPMDEGYLFARKVQDPALAADVVARIAAGPRVAPRFD